MEEQLRLIVELQRKDSRIAMIERMKKSYPIEIEKLNGELDAQKKALEKIKEECESLQKERRKKERNLDNEIDKIKKYEGQLFNVKTNKEYQALLTEISQAKEVNSQLEDEIIILLDRIEAMENKIEVMEKDHEEKKRLVGIQVKKIQKELENFKKEILEQKSQSELLIRKIHSDLLQHYHKMMAKSNGLAVVPVIDGTCKGCHLSIPPQLFNEIQKRANIKYCPHCFRILYWEPLEAQGG